MLADIATVVFAALFAASAGICAYFWVMSRRGPSVPLDGAAAYREGFVLADNPHSAHSPNHSIWRDDWLDIAGRAARHR